MRRKLGANSPSGLCRLQLLEEVGDKGIQIFLPMGTSGRANRGLRFIPKESEK